MSDYVEIIKSNDIIQVCLYNEEDKPLAIGEKINFIN